MADDGFARAEAAEAEVKRLREALWDIAKDGVFAEGHWSGCCGDDDVMCSVHDILNKVAALATPPSEGGTA